jgi:hypothetical protein
MADRQVRHRRSRRAGAGSGYCLQQWRFVEQQQLDDQWHIAVRYAVEFGQQRRDHHVPEERDALHQRHDVPAAGDLEPVQHG